MPGTERPEKLIPPSLGCRMRCGVRCSTGRIGVRGGMRGAIRGSLWCAVRGAGCIGVSSVVRYSAGGGSLAGGAPCGVRCGMGWSPGPGSTRWQDAEGLRAAVPEPERI